MSTELVERKCACGCQRTFRTRSDTRIYYETNCWNRAQYGEDSPAAKAAASKAANRVQPNVSHPRLQGSQ